MYPEACCQFDGNGIHAVPEPSLDIAVFCAVTTTQAISSQLKEDGG